MTSVADASVKKSVTVNASVQHAFDVFTRGFDGWWPRSHHIGKSPMKEAIIESGVGGRCYTKQEDGTESDWGQILEWDPPNRFVMAWQITHEWGYEPDLTKSSEVEIRFTRAARRRHARGSGASALRADGAGWRHDARGCGRTWRLAGPARPVQSSRRADEWLMANG